MKDNLKIPDSSTTRLKILFADDEPALQELMHLELPRMGHEVTICPDGGFSTAGSRLISTHPCQSASREAPETGSTPSEPLRTGRSPDIA